MLTGQCHVLLQVSEDISDEAKEEFAKVGTCAGSARGPPFPL